MMALAQTTAMLERRLFDEALPLWWVVGADHDRGGFHEAIVIAGAPTASNRRARVQARQAYVYATAGVGGWDGPWRAAMDHGLDYLLTRYMRPDGLVRASVDVDGAPVNDAAMLYDQAFVLLALAAVLRAGPSRVDLVGRAHALLRAIGAAYQHDGRGFCENSTDHPFHADPLMHLLEAAIAWSEIDADPAWPRLVDRLASLALTAFIDGKTGVVREYFSADWRPAAGASGGIVEPGHQFEWSWLLRSWRALGKHRDAEDAFRAAARLFSVESRFGVDRARGVAFHSMTDALTPLDLTSRLWPQTEWIKAALTQAGDAGDLSEGDRLLSEAGLAVDGLLLFLDAPVRGAWRDKLGAAGEFVDEAAPASSFYHSMGAIEALSARGVVERGAIQPPSNQGWGH